MNRRSFLRAAALGAGTVALGPNFWRAAYAAPAQPGTVYGPLLAPDANGVRLPAGFSSRVVARSLEPVGTSGYVWHAAPDGGACFSVSDGGWIYVSNSEVPLVGGVGALRFDAAGTIVAAHRVLIGTSANCAGGQTPWGTWLTCEEFDGGHVFECDPKRLNDNASALRPGLGTFTHEAAAVDPVRQLVYLTEDEGDGRLYRFTSSAWPDLRVGVLEAARLTPQPGFDPNDPRWTVDWLAIPNPNIVPGTTPTRQQVPATTAFVGGEGIWYDSGHVYFATKGDNRVWDLDAATSEMQLLYDDNLVVGSAPLSGVDNLVVNRAGEIFVAEDGGDMQLVVIGADRSVEPFLQLVGHAGSEITGPAFDPSGTRLYFSSQRGAGATEVAGENIGAGVTFEVTGPFHGQGNVAATPDGLVSGLVHDVVEPPVRTVSPDLGDALHVIDRAISRLGL